MATTKLSVTQTSIKTPFLKLLLRYFGNLSIQLYPVNVKSTASLLNCAWNFALNAVFWYEMITITIVYYDRCFQSMAQSQVFSEKPLFHLLIFTVMQNVFPICFTLRFFFFFKISLSKKSNLVYLLDKLSWNSIGNDNRHLKKYIKTFVFVVFIEQLFSFIIIIYIVIDMKLSLLSSALQYLTLHTLNINSNITFFLVFYYKYATLQSLKRALTSFKVSGNLETLQREIIHQAYLNCKLNSRISFVFIVTLVPHIIQIIISFTCVLVEQVENSYNNSFIIEFSIATISIVSVCSAIEKQLVEIQFIILTHQTKRQHTRIFFKTNVQKLSLNYYYDQECLKWNEFVPIFKKCFQLKIYNFFTFNWRFVFLLIIFLCNFVVLVSQTSVIN